MLSLNCSIIYGLHGFWGLKRLKIVTDSWECRVVKFKTEAAVISLLKQLEDGQDDVVDIAKTRGLRLLGMVESTCPVDGDVCLLLVQLHCSSLSKKC